MTETDFLRLVHRKFEEYSILVVHKADRLSGEPFLVSLSVASHLFRAEGRTLKQCFSQLARESLIKTGRKEDAEPQHYAPDRRRR